MTAGSYLRLIETKLKNTGIPWENSDGGINMGIILAANADHIINNILSYAIYALGAAAPVLFIVFLILCIVQIVKVKKKGAGKTKAVVCGCISGYFLLVTGAEIAFVLLLASAIAHM